MRGGRSRRIGVLVAGVLAAGALVLPSAGATPTQTSPPTISGNPVVGSTLTGGTGSWQSNGRGGVTYSARYFEGCQGRTCGIVARETTTYVLTSADVGKSFHYCVVASDGLAPDASDCSSYTQAVTDAPPPPPPSNTSRPTISGQPAVGAQLTGTPGTWQSSDQPGLHFNTRWESCDTEFCTLEAQGSSFTYVVKASDEGRTLRLCVQGLDKYGSSGFVCSLDTAAAFVPDSAPAISAINVAGGVQVGSTPQATAVVTGKPAPTVTWTWERCDPGLTSCSTPIKSSGANPSSYKVVASDAGRVFRITATAKNSQGTATKSRVVGPVSSKPDPSCAGLDPWGDPDGDSIRTAFECSATVSVLGGLFKIEEDLPALGAKPLRKDIFVEADAMSGLTISQQATDAVEKAFWSAPVSNPDGTNGITLHIDNGPSSRIHWNTDTTWGNRSRSSVVPYQRVLGDGTGSPGVWKAVDTVKDSYFKSSRQFFYHYLLFGNRYDKASNGSSGLARAGDFTVDGLGADFIMTFGGWCESDPDKNPDVDVLCNNSVTQQAGTIMHEMGHTLGLGHGGRENNVNDNENRKPNYPSVMNYNWQLSGIKNRFGTGYSLDYSRFGSDKLPTLDENNLDEKESFKAPGIGIAYLGMYRCASSLAFKTFDFSQSAGVDFNCNGLIDTSPVAANINRINKDDESAAGVKNTLVPRNDWSNLVFSGGAVGGLGQSNVSGEPGVDMVLADLPPEPVVNDDTTTDPTSTPQEMLPAVRQLLGDSTAPTVKATWGRQKASLRKLKVTFAGLDNKGIDTVRLQLRKVRTTRYTAKPGVLRLATVRYLVPGLWRVRLSADDKAGFHSPVLSRTLKVSCPKGKPCRGTWSG